MLFFLLLSCDCQILCKYFLAQLYSKFDLHNTPSSSLQARPCSDVNLRNGRQQTPLLLAVDKRHVTIAKLLLENGAQVNAQDDVGDSPLHVVVMYHSLKFGGSNTPKKEVS